jgi:hypothetical protein
MAASTAAAGQVRGVVSDGSGGVRPRHDRRDRRDGRVLATATTDGTGSYALDALPDDA